MDMDEVTSDVKQKHFSWFEVKQRDGYRHATAKCVLGKNMYQFLRCGRRSIHDKVPVTCYAPHWIQANRKGEAKSKNRLRHRFLVRSSSADVVRLCRSAKKIHVSPETQGCLSA